MHRLKVETLPNFEGALFVVGTALLGLQEVQDDAFAFGAIMTV